MRIEEIKDYYKAYEGEWSRCPLLPSYCPVTVQLSGLVCLDARSLKQDALSDESRSLQAIAARTLLESNRAIRTQYSVPGDGGIAWQVAKNFANQARASRKVSHRRDFTVATDFAARNESNDG